MSSFRLRVTTKKGLPIDSSKTELRMSVNGSGIKDHLHEMFTLAQMQSKILEMSGGKESYSNCLSTNMVIISGSYSS